MFGMKKKQEQEGNPKKSMKLEALRALKKTATDMMGDKLSGLKKVTVAAPTTEGVKAGLEKAEDLMESMPNGEESEESEELVPMDHSPEEDSLTVEEIDAEIERLQELKKQKLAE